MECEGEEKVKFHSLSLLRKANIMPDCQPFFRGLQNSLIKIFWKRKRRHLRAGGHISRNVIFFSRTMYSNLPRSSLHFPGDDLKIFVPFIKTTTKWEIQQQTQQEYLLAHVEFRRFLRLFREKPMCRVQMILTIRLQRNDEFYILLSKKYFHFFLFRNWKLCNIGIINVFSWIFLFQFFYFLNLRNYK